jgi:DNA repair exonuclease SbcCD ATPase subunit
MTKAKTDIIAAQKAGDDAMTYAKTNVEPIANEAKETADTNKADIATINGNLGQLTTKVTTIETTYQTKKAAEDQHKEINNEIAALQAALGTGGTGADSITSRLTTAEADIDKLQ